MRKPQKKKVSKGRKVPEDGLACLQDALTRLGDERVEIEVRGRFAYIECEGAAVCRLGYTGDLEAWDFAIYKYSTGTYSTEFLRFPEITKAYEGIVRALKAYQLM